MSKIEWTDESWNPVVGCSKVSPGCDNCYAERMAKRLAGMGRCIYETVTEVRGKEGEGVFGGWNGRIVCSHTALEIPLHWRKPRMIFVCSMSDLFHPSVPCNFTGKVIDIAKRCKQHTFQFLTKRPENAQNFVFPQNCWLGVTAENQEQADKRIPILLQIPAAVRFVSIEPMLGKINIEKYLHCGLGWCIMGAESGKNARFMDEKWVRSLISQCKKNKIPVFYKQKRVGNRMVKMPQLDGKVYAEYPQIIGKQSEN